MASPTPRALLVGHTLSDLTKNKHKVSRLILLRQDSTIEEALKVWFSFSYDQTMLGQVEILQG